MLELTTSWKEEGRQQGRQEECARVVSRQLQRRLGSLDPAMEARLRELPLERLEALAEALLDFASMADLSDWLAQA